MNSTCIASIHKCIEYNYLIQNNSVSMLNFLSLLNELLIVPTIYCVSRQFFRLKKLMHLHKKNNLKHFEMNSCISILTTCKIKRRVVGLKSLPHKCTRNAIIKRSHPPGSIFSNEFPWLMINSAAVWMKLKFFFFLFFVLLFTI